MPTRFDIEKVPTLEKLAQHATALRLAISGACFEDREDVEALDELAYGLELALEVGAEHEAAEIAADRKAGLARAAHAAAAAWKASQSKAGKKRARTKSAA